MPLFSTGQAPGAAGAATLVADATGFPVNLTPGARIAGLSQPFGAGTAYAAVGAVPAALALDAAGLVIAGNGAASGGTAYALKIRATSADGKREVAETLGFTATGAAAAGPATLPVTPAARWHPAYSTVTTSGGRVTGASDIQGLAAAVEGAAGIGPLAMVDAAGRAFWRFQGAEYLTVANTLVADQRAVAVFMVGRHHRSQTTTFFGQGSVAAGTASSNTLGATLNTSSASGIPPHVKGCNISAAADADHRNQLVLGSQMQLVGVASRAAAGGGQRVMLNGIAANIAQTGTAVTGIAGAEIGRYAYAPGASGTWGMFDLYEMVIFTRTLSDAEADSVAAALVSAWSIPAVTHQLVLEGDSITQGVGTMKSGESLGMQLTRPGGSGTVPAGWRVVNMGVSGNQIAALVTRRDLSGGIATCLMPGGRNVLAVQIGRNNFSAGAQTGQQVYDAIVAFHRNGSTGYLERGWEVRQAINVAVGSALETQNTALRGLLRAPQFLADLQAASGQAYAGKVGLIDLPLLTVAGSGTIFDTVADAADLAWFQNDSTHPNAAGTVEMARGYAAAL